MWLDARSIARFGWSTARLLCGGYVRLSERGKQQCTAATLVQRWLPAAVLQYFCSILMLLHQGSSKPAGTVRYRRRANVIHSVLRVVRMRGIVVVDREESYGVFRIHLPLSYKLNSPKVEVEAAAAKHLQPCTAHSGRNASVTKLATPASSERARRRPRTDDEASGCSKAHAAVHRAQ
eukprot:scaffold72988_cov46-Phaeocystis_antarctica.AAC.3